MPKFITIEQKNDAVCEAIQTAYNIPDTSVRVYDYTNLTTDPSNYAIKTDTQIDGSLFVVVPDDVLNYNDNLLCFDLTNVNNYTDSAALSYNDAITIAIKMYDPNAWISSIYIYVRDDAHRPINIAFLKTSDEWDIRHVTTGHAAKVVYSGIPFRWNIIHNGAFGAKESSMPYVTQSGVSKCKKSIIQYEPGSTIPGTENFAYHVPASRSVKIPVSAATINEMLLRDGQEAFFTPVVSTVGTAVTISAPARIEDNGRIIGYNASSYLDSSLSIPSAGGAVSMAFSPITGVYAAFERMRHEYVKASSSLSPSDSYFLIDKHIASNPTITTATIDAYDKLIKK